jgi:hypothetical protein
MPNLSWDETDFVETLEVLPQTEEYGTKHLFVVERDELRLQIAVWQHESVVCLDLYRKGIESPIIGCAFYVRGDIRRVNEHGADYLELQNSLPVPSRFSYLDFKEDLRDPQSIRYGLTARVHVHPHIRIEFVREPL